MNDEEILNLSGYKYAKFGSLNMKKLCLNYMQKARADERQKILELIENKFKWTSLKSPKKWKQIKQLAQSEDKT